MQVASQNTGNYFSTGGGFININQNKQERTYQKNRAVKLEVLQSCMGCSLPHAVQWQVSALHGLVLEAKHMLLKAPL